MHHRGWKLAALGAATIVGLSPAAAAEGEEPDPEVLADREARAAVDAASGITRTEEVQVGHVAPPPGLRVKDLYYLDAKNTSNGFAKVFARDHPAQDAPGWATTTMRIYGNAAAFRDGVGQVELESRFTCTGAGIGSLTIGATSVAITGGPTSQTLTWTSERTNTSVVRQSYAEGGHFRCKASNATPAKTTRRGFATARYKESDVRAEDSYSFWW